MYGGSLPRAASQLLRDHVQARSSSAPPMVGSGGMGGSSSSGKVWSTGLAARGERKHVDLRIPKVGQKKEAQCLPPRPPIGRKTQEQIILETENYRKQEAPALPLARDRAKETRLLQDKCAYNLGSALPTTVAPPGVSAKTAPSEPTTRRNVSFASGAERRYGSADPSPRGTSGLTAEQESMADDIIRGVHQRQSDLDDVEQKFVHLTSRAEAVGEGTDQRRVVRKQLAGVSQKRLELKSAIERDMQDLGKLLDCAPSAA